ncbi:hypothetical protein, partial [Candidatus Amarobacter glycogenicus]|uniref:hypothetical protein n=1 Tax=Candidatus Amarobacter glycogenicus TaxID=3140699 RepID=UPI002A0F5CA0|nr:hypothetical protein [Dehalococcoidia bacterium]
RGDPAWFESEWPQIERAWNAGQRWGDATTLLVYLNAALPLDGPLGLWTTVIAWITQGLPWVQEVSNNLREGVLLENLGYSISCVVTERGHWRSYEEALALAEAFPGQVYTGALLGRRRAVCGNYQPQRALTYLRRAVTIADQVGNRKDASQWLDPLGRVYAALGQNRKLPAVSRRRFNWRAPSATRVW